MDLSPQTHIFKVTGDCFIQADVYQPEGEGRKPAVLWIHGGALIFGTRKWVAAEQFNLYLNAGTVVVSIDYRLAPETKLPAILEDVQDAYHWLITSGSELFNIDPDRIAVMGHSAGGYLTLMTGFMVHPRPRALVSFYGYGDIVGDWYSCPDTYYSKEPAIPMEEARKEVGGPVISGSEDFEHRWQFYVFCRQKGLWPEEVTGYNPHTQLEAFEPFCPARNVTPDYPPTLLLHGDQDTDVPYELSVQMAAVLEENHVPHRLITMGGMGHMFDSNPDGLKNPKVAEAFVEVLDFLKKNL
jgi:acetyl esterase/lipase